MTYIIKSQSGYYQGTICGENHFTNDKKDALKFKSDKAAKKTIKFHSIHNAEIEIN